jgi:serine/threonine-protein kinase
MVELAVGAVVADRYQLDRLLGLGGMAIVWAATDRVSTERVALKFLKAPPDLRREFRKRFLREARAASAIQHPNVLEIRDVFDLDDGTTVLAMELLIGETLGERVARAGHLSVEDTANIAVQVVSALGTAHAVGVVHRDLKPDNIFLVGVEGCPPFVRVLDFGIAKLVGFEGPTVDTGALTRPGTILGTPGYMPLEQCLGENDIDHRADIWSLGAILYECLTGARPVEGDHIGQVVKRLANDSITPLDVLLPDLPADMAALVMRMLSRERDRRPSDLHEVDEVLSRHASVRAPEFGSR